MYHVHCSDLSLSACGCLQLYTPSRTLRSASDILSLRFLVPDFPLLVPAPFLSTVPLHGMTFPFLSDRDEASARDLFSHTPSLAFRHLSPNSAITGYATDGSLLVSAYPCPSTLSASPETHVEVTQRRSTHVNIRRVRPKYKNKSHLD